MRQFAVLLKLSAVMSLVVNKQVLIYLQFCCTATRWL